MQRISRGFPVAVPMLACVLSALPAQGEPTGTGQGGTSPRPRSSAAGVPSPWEQGQGQGAETRPSPTGDADLDGLIPVWTRPEAPRAFRGFPVFPDQLGGYGSYPRSLSEVFAAAPAPNVPFGFPGGGDEPEAGWPAWALRKGRAPLPYESGVALLVQSYERVWWRSEESEPFVPLYTYDKLRAVRAGAEVEIRHAGQFDLLLHGGSRLLARGQTRLRVEALDEERVALALDGLTWVRLEAFGRRHVLRLPDRSTLRIGAASGEKEAAPVTRFSPAMVVIERADEPGWRSGRASLWNGGGAPLDWDRGDQRIRIAPGERVVILLHPPGTPPADLVAGEHSFEGDAVRCRAGRGGVVSWSGASFAVGSEATVRFDPVAGHPFASRTEASKIP